MNRTIWKFGIPIEDSFMIEMPRNAHVLTVATQQDGPQMWAYVDPKAARELRRFLLVGTGHDIDVGAGRYIGTFQMQQGTLVFHVFED